jgi:hypothetical protein
MRHGLSMKSTRTLAVNVLTSEVSSRSEADKADEAMVIFEQSNHEHPV